MARSSQEVGWTVGWLRPSATRGRPAWAYLVSLAIGMAPAAEGFAQTAVLQPVSWRLDDTVYRFSSIDALAVDEHGHIAVLNRAEQSLTLLSSTPPFRQRLLGPGRGPREIGRAAQHLAIRGDTVFVPDPSEARVVWSTIDGKANGTVPWPPAGVTVQLAAGPRSSASVLEIARPLRVKNGKGYFLSALEVREASDGGVRRVASLTLNPGDSLSEVMLLGGAPHASVFRDGRSYQRVSGKPRYAP